MLDPLVEKKVKRHLERLLEVEDALGRPAVLNDQKQFRALAQEHAFLAEIRSLTDNITRCHRAKIDNAAMLSEEKDPEFVAILKEDNAQLEAKLTALQQELGSVLVPPDPNDHRTTILELRAGTGGDEAALFVGDCVRMYKLFADSQKWTYETLTSNPSDLGGFKEYIMVLSGQNVHRLLQYEGGTHRVQRVPATEAQGRIHTSAITIAVMLEPDEDEELVLDEKDLRYDTYRSSGAGGQHVNTTDSAVRITHLPTGIVSYCQAERSQHKNKATAMRLLRAKIIEKQQEEKRAAEESVRSGQVGSGDRSERIRTYNFPQNRLTDHRINLTVYNLDRVMNGTMLEVVTALVAFFHKQNLEE